MRPQLADAVERQRAAALILQIVPRRQRALDRERLGRVGAAVRAAVAPFRALRDAVRAVRKYGGATASVDGISRARQFVAMWWLSVRYGYESTTIYRYRLFSWDDIAPTPRFIQAGAAALLYRVVAQHVDRQAAAVLADKRAFAAWCARERLATVPILLAFSDGRIVTASADGPAPPATDLFAKWGSRYGGDSTVAWQCEGEHFRDAVGRRWQFDEIVASLVERSREGLVLLQPRLENHRALRELFPKSLNTLRIMTTRRPGADPQLLAGVLRLGTGSSTADNFAQGGIASAVDRETGVLQDACTVDAAHRTWRHTRHPDSGVTITGRRVPFWRESVELALEAHARLGDLPCVGWDVAVLEEGPILLEGNWNPCTKLLQVANRTPLLATEFASVHALWLARIPRARDGRWLIAQRRWEPLRH